MILNWDHFSKIPVDLYQKLQKIGLRSDPEGQLENSLKDSFCRALSFGYSAKQQIDTSSFPHPLKNAACSVLRVSYMLIIDMTYKLVCKLFAMEAIQDTVTKLGNGCSRF